MTACKWRLHVHPVLTTNKVAALRVHMKPPFSARS